MKKLFTLAAASTLATLALGAQAQVTVDGVLTAPELTSGNYVLLGKYTNPRSFGDHGLLSMYAASTATKVYIFVAGSVETNTNAFELFLDLPLATSGVPAGTALPAATTPAGNYFANLTVKMEMPVDLALALRASTRGATTFRLEAAKYTNATTVTSKQVTATATPLASDGTVMTLPLDTDFPMLAGARVAYKTTDASGNLGGNPGSVTPNTAATYGGAGSYGWELELDRAAISALTSSSLTAFVLQNGDNGDYISSDFIPQSTTPIPSTPNYGSIGNGNVDFATIPGLQAVSFNLSAAGVTLGSKAAAEALALGVYPNPATDRATIAYKVAAPNTLVHIALVDLLGRTVRVVEHSVKSAGEQSASLSTRDVTAGTYLMRVQVGDNVATSKVVLL